MDGGEAKGWTGESLGRLYAECCRTREEPGIERVRRALRVRRFSLDEGPLEADDEIAGEPYYSSKGL